MVDDNSDVTKPAAKKSSGRKSVAKISGPKAVRRLVVCLDGTWNTDDREDITNIVRIRDLVDPKFTDPETGTVEHQRVYYDAGVGTGGLTDTYVGGSTGAGLEDNVRQAYRFLSQYYEPGVEIFIFGFSRGAFTARSLAGFIGSSGLMQPQFCNRENENRAWSYYRIPPKEREPAERINLQRFMFPDLTIKLVGVFDTVGARGIPGELFKTINRVRYGFHDVSLASNIDYALHALAVDERRGPFGASVWQYPNHKNNKCIEQVWFAGVHSNIGGGYPDRGLSDLALEWMLQQIERNGLGLRLVRDWRKEVATKDP